MDLYEILQNLDIKYEKVEHEAVFTVDDVKKIEISIEGIGCKNLFLTNRKGKYYLVILQEDKKANIKEIAKMLGGAHLSFASEEDLKKILNLEKGSCTPFGIINDTENKVLLLMDKELKNQKLLFHPNRNTATISIEFDDLIKFIEYEKHEYILI